MKRLFASIVVLGAALTTGCATTTAPASAARQPAQAGGSPLLANATDASLGLTFPVGQATREQLLANFGEPDSLITHANGSGSVSFSHSADTKNCNHRRTLTRTAEFQFDQRGVVTYIKLRQGAQWQ